MSRKVNRRARGSQRATVTAVRQDRGDLFKLGNILVPIDFSRTSLKALEYALPLAKRFGAHLHLVYALDYDYARSTLSEMPLAIAEAEMIGRARRRLEDTAEKHGTALAAEECHVVKGRPYHAICQPAPT